MASSQDNRFLKVFIAILIALLLLLSYWSYTTYQENEAIKDDLTIEKTRIEKELDNISLEYAAQIDKGNLLNNELIDARERIIRLRDSVVRLEGSVAVMARLRKELGRIKEERAALNARIVELEENNNYLLRVNDSTLAKLNEEIIKSEMQTETVAALNKNIKEAATLIPTNLKTEGVILRRSGKQIINDRASRVDDLKVCFTLPENALATQGINQFYLQVINPENNVMGAGKTVNFDEQTLTYSSIITFKYSGKELDICELLNANKDRIVKGAYRINLYKGAIRVGSTSVSFK